MELPNKLKEVLESEVNKYKINELKVISEEMTNKYKHESGNDKRLVTTLIEVCTYVAVRMPATYSTVYKVIESCMEFFNEEITSVLDIGAGIGTASFAISELMPNVVAYELVEREENMILFGKKLADSYNLSGKFVWFNEDIKDFKYTKKYDLVIASYSLNELSKAERQEIISQLWNVTNKLLIVIEPGTKEGYEQIRNEREFLINAGGHIVAPCSSIKPCPIEKEDWCHFTCRVSRSKIHKQIKEADVPYEDEKFSYIAFSKNDVTHCKVRVLRHPIIERGKITLKTCENGELKVRLITKKQKELFKKARKIDAGESFDEIT